MEISILNFGTYPAEDIDVYMHFPDGFTLDKLDNFPNKPQKPQPPSEPVPRTMSERMNDRLLLNLSSLSIPSLPPIKDSQNRTPSNISSVDIRRSNSYNVTLHVGKLKQHTLETIDEMTITFNSIDQVSSFSIDYQLIAANIPNPVYGKLHVIFTEKSEDEKE
ncbi:MAG: hypothetical protein QNJ42_24815 [Crocosphaera sp.]|nr:hypothetical protein [Crocosphaera sp.]